MTSDATNAAASGRSALLADPQRARRNLFDALLDAREAFGAKTPILEDLQRQPVTYARLVLGALVIGRKLAAGTRERERVGVFLPSVQAARSRSSGSSPSDASRPC